MEKIHTDPMYDPRQSKDTTPHSLALRYMHFILSHTLTSHGDNTGVIRLRDFEFLLSILDGFKLHLDMRWLYLLPIKG